MNRYRNKIRLSIVAFSLVVISFAVYGCGDTLPLLSTLEKSFAPLTVGSYWLYEDANGNETFKREVTASGKQFDRDTYTLTLSVAQTGPAGRLNGIVNISDTGLNIYDVTSGIWRLERMLPYIIGTKWDLEKGAGEASKVFEVSAVEGVSTAVGDISDCYILTETTTPIGENPVTVDMVVWVAPEIGDIKYAHVDVSGEVIVDHILKAYYIAPEGQ